MVVVVLLLGGMGNYNKKSNYFFCVLDNKYSIKLHKKLKTRTRYNNQILLHCPTTTEREEREEGREADYIERGLTTKLSLSLSLS